MKSALCTDKKHISISGYRKLLLFLHPGRIEQIISFRLQNNSFKENNEVILTKVYHNRMLLFNNSKIENSLDIFNVLMFKEVIP